MPQQIQNHGTPIAAMLSYKLKCYQSIIIYLYFSENPIPPVTPPQQILGSCSHISQMTHTPAADQCASMNLAQLCTPTISHPSRKQ
jgi:hypothetical protein